MTGILAMKPYLDHFGTGIDGSGVSLVFSMYSVGSLAGSFPAAFIADRFGRKWGMWSGAGFIILGMIIAATAPGFNQLVGGRVVLGCKYTFSGHWGRGWTTDMHLRGSQLDEPFRSCSESNRRGGGWGRLLTGDTVLLRDRPSSVAWKDGRYSQLRVLRRIHLGRSRHVRDQLHYQRLCLADPSHLAGQPLTCSSDRRPIG